MKANSKRKNQLEVITGISVHYQILRLERTSNLAGHGGEGEGPGVKEIIAHLTEEERTLDDYGVQEWNTIRVSRVLVTP